MKRQPTPTPTESRLMCVRTASDVLKDWSSNVCVPTRAPHFLLKSILLFPTWNLEPYFSHSASGWLVSFLGMLSQRTRTWMASHNWNLTVQEPRSLKSGCQRGCAPSEVSREGLFLTTDRVFLGCGCLSSSDTGVLPANLTPSSLCVRTVALLIRIPAMSG